MVNDGRTLLFMHIPKTAGITMRSVIRRNYERDRIFEVRVDLAETLRRFKDMPRAEREKYEAVIGHFGPDLHPVIPGDWAYATVLREPSARVISEYFYILRMESHNRHEAIAGRDLSITDVFDRQMIPTWDNGQTRILSNTGKKAPFGECTEEMLETAKRNIETYCAVAGVLERFDETLVLMGREFEWKKLGYARQNADPKRVGRRPVTEEEMETIHRYNELDRRLYDWVNERLDARIESLGASFANDVKRMNARNRAFVVLSSVGRRVRGSQT